MRVAIVGAGISGLACARRLDAADHAVTVFDKGRRPGGRMSSRSLATAQGAAGFDHGAQYFTARDPAFQAEVARWHAAGTAARWPAAGDDAWVGVPRMNTPAAAMAAGLDVRSEVRIDGLRRDGAIWRLAGVSDPFDAAIVALPAEQAAPLLAKAHPDAAALAAATPSQPCWTVMVAFAAPVPVPGDVLRDAGAVGWAARDSAKPGRSGPESWVIQASPEWSRAHLEDEPETVVAALTAAFSQAVGSLPVALISRAHRWRYARSGGAGDGMVWDAALGLGVCGDWLLGPRIEAAWLSGDRLGAAIGRQAQHGALPQTP